MGSKMAISWLDRFLLGVAPKWGTARIQAKAALRSYEAAGKGRRTSGWTRTSADANSAASGALAPLREYSRDLRRNNAWAKRGMQVIGTNTVGWGIDGKATGELATEAQAIWKSWSRNTNLDYDGRLTFSGIQRLAMDTIVESGEVLILRERAKPADGLPVPVRLRVLEPDFIDTNKSGSGQNGNPIVQGIETDGRGRRVAYWLYTQHPGAGGLGIFLGNGLTSKRIPAADVLHVYRSERPGQMRGVPWLASTIARLNDLDEYEDAKLVQQKVAALFAAFVKDMDGQAQKLGADDPDGNEEIEELEPGSVHYLKPGQEVTFPTPPTVADHGDFSAATLRAIAAGLGVTYEDLTQDYSKVNFSSARMGRLSHYANVHDWRWNMLVPQLLMGVWGWVMETAAGLNDWDEVPGVQWAAPPMPMISPDKEILSLNRAVRGGFKTLPQALRELGEDPDTHIAEIAETNALLDANAIILDSDPRHTSTSGGAQNAVEIAQTGSDDDEI